ncbi:hypothetical protein BVI434_150004 [Burkholderia vietnamiensis]|nr:hypothetical protein BVI434_150004 [Burkholderia vietnamiensis]
MPLFVHRPCAAVFRPPWSRPQVRRHRGQARASRASRHIRTQAHRALFPAPPSRYRRAASAAARLHHRTSKRRAIGRLRSCGKGRRCADALAAAPRRPFLIHRRIIGLDRRRDDPSHRAARQRKACTPRAVRAAQASAVAARLRRRAVSPASAMSRRLRMDTAHVSEAQHFAISRGRPVVSRAGRHATRCRTQRTAPRVVRGDATGATQRPRRAPARRARSNCETFDALPMRRGRRGRATRRVV